MKSLSQQIKESLAIRESISKDLKDQCTAYTVDHKAATFYRKDLLDALEYILDYKKEDNLSVNGWDPFHPHTMAYKYAGIEDGVMKLQYHHNDDFINKDMVSRLKLDLEQCDDDIIKIEFDNGVSTNSSSTGKILYVQSCTFMNDETFSPNAITMVFEA